jgi:hypothetical protein
MCRHWPKPALPFHRLYFLTPALRAPQIANLAYSWQAANLGPSASAREAQYWHHQWRPGFTDRLTREWVHIDCFDDDHRPGGATERPDRFTHTGR